MNCFAFGSLRRALLTACALVAMVVAGAWAQYDACYDNPNASELDLCISACDANSKLPWCSGGGGGGGGGTVTVLGTWNVGPKGEDGKNSDKVKATLTSDGKVTISGSGPMRNYDYLNVTSNGVTYSSIMAPWIKGNDEESMMLPNYNSGMVTSFVIENGVTSIGNFSCYQLKNLKSVTIPNSVTKIGYGAFSGCTGLTSITIPNSVISISGKAFNGCPALTSIAVPNKLEDVGDSVFAGRIDITSIPKSIKHIANSAFAGCTGLMSIPDTLIDVGGHAFDGCTGLKSISITIIKGINSIGEYYDGTIQDSAFSGLTGLTSASFIINGGQFDYKALDGLTAPTSITINYWYKSSYSAAFPDCPGLTSLTINTNSIDIPRGMFKGNTTLSAVTICSSGVIADSAFKNVPNLSKLILGDYVTSIGVQAFAACSSLTSVTIPKNVQSIGNAAFANTSLTSISIPKNVKKIGTSAFSGCANLAFAAVASDTIGASAFNGLTSLTNIAFGNGVKSIGSYAFGGCTKLTTLTIPDGVTTVDTGAFNSCPRLQTVTIGNGVETINQNAFSGCSGVTSMIIGNKVKSIGSGAFNNCTGLESLTSLASDPPVVYVPTSSKDTNPATFAGVDVTSCKLKVQQVDMGMYRSAAGWKDFANIEAVTFPNVPVIDITGVPERFKVGEVLTLVGTVTPSTATNKSIEWSVAGASIAGTNFTGAVIEGGNKLSAAAPGTVVVRAAIPSGAITGVDFERYFFIAAEAEEQEVVSVSSRERVVPSVSSVDVAVVSPVGRLSAEFAAGPNPVGRQSGAVRFFRSGAMITGGSLSVYDGSGNVVGSVSIRDGGVGVRRVVGSWDLRDARGRLVPEGTYLVRGAVTTRDGKREKVSVVVGVR